MAIGPASTSSIVSSASGRFSNASRLSGVSSAEAAKGTMDGGYRRALSLPSASLACAVSSALQIGRSRICLMSFPPSRRGGRGQLRQDRPRWRRDALGSARSDRHKDRRLPPKSAATPIVSSSRRVPVPSRESEINRRRWSSGAACMSTKPNSSNWLTVRVAPGCVMPTACASSPIVKGPARSSAARKGYWAACMAMPYSSMICWVSACRRSPMRRKRLPMHRKPRVRTTSSTKGNLRNRSAVI